MDKCMYTMKLTNIITANLREKRWIFTPVHIFYKSFVATSVEIHDNVMMIQMVRINRATIVLLTIVPTQKLSQSGNVLCFDK